MPKLHFVEMSGDTSPFRSVMETVHEWLQSTKSSGPFQLPGIEIDAMTVGYVTASLEMFAMLGIMQAHGELASFTKALIAVARGKASYVLTCDKGDTTAVALVTIDASDPLDVCITLTPADSGNRDKR